MHRLLTMKRLSVLFLATFAVLMGGMFAYEKLVVAPGDRCEAGGKWWDPQGRVCAQPISIAEITGRPLPGQRAAASAEKNRELVAIEDSLAAQRAARDAEADRQRAALAAQ
ncbi:hypothetical protein [Brevundimonas sp.]|uniref:hypothetical protein n=1 Tax=Brevundimonas sp. TaxID=1871086 RepID=UPI002737FCEB|nr:hypothetical protein [Brevundimonas sp.]MDP3802678.1 hypothetical protein [Brevundimonas sp.]